MPESAAEESTVNPYISPKEDKENAGRLKPDVASQVHYDIRQEAKRLGLKIKQDDSPEEKERKTTALLDLFNTRSGGDLPDYQAVQIVDLEEKADRDPLTGLLNRRGFKTEFAGFLEDAKKLGKPILFLMLDLDYFKKINDTYGHDIGDQALKYLARAVTQSVEIEDLAARWGGEEFVIAFKPKEERPVDGRELFLAAERIHRQIIDLLSKDRYQLQLGKPETKLPDQITLSVGATLSRPGDTLEIICQRADENLYRAKNNGRNQSFGDGGKIIPTPPPGDPPKTASS